MSEMSKMSEKENRLATKPRNLANDLAREISDSILHGKKTLWLIPGGSNIPISVCAMDIIKESVIGKPKVMSNLYITLTDERFGPVGHADSNWTQLEKAGFDFSYLSLSAPYSYGVNAEPVLLANPGGDKTLDLEETVKSWEKRVVKLFDSADIIIGQFGIGADGHIAGILPGSPAVSCKSMVCGYTSPKFTRITLTFPALRRVNSAYAFAFGEEKRPALEKLMKVSKDAKDAMLAQIPAGILKLKSLNKSYLYSDVFDVLQTSLT